MRIRKLFSKPGEILGDLNAAALGHSALHCTKTNFGRFGQDVKSAFHASGSLREAARGGDGRGGGFYGPSPAMTRTIGVLQVMVGRSFVCGFRSLRIPAKPIPRYTFPHAPSLRADLGQMASFRPWMSTVWRRNVIIEGVSGGRNGTSMAADSPIMPRFRHT